MWAEAVEESEQPKMASRIGKMTQNSSNGSRWLETHTMFVVDHSTGGGGSSGKLVVHNRGGSGNSSSGSCDIGGIGLG